MPRVRAFRALVTPLALGDVLQVPLDAIPQWSTIRSVTAKLSIRVRIVLIPKIVRAVIVRIA